MQRVELDCTSLPHFFGCWTLKAPGLCDLLIDFFESHPDQQVPGTSGDGHHVNLEIKKTTDISVKPKDLAKPSHSAIAAYLDELRECFADYCKQWPFLVSILPEVDIAEFNIQKYLPGGHFAGVHSERMTLATSHRVLVWMTYLNDVEKGGETHFTHYGLKVQPKRARTLIWPAEWTHSHAGNVVEAGAKYIITGWMHFPHSK